MDLVEAVLIAKIENGSAKMKRHKHRHRHEHGKETASQSQTRVHDGQDKHKQEVIQNKRGKEHLDSSQQISSQDVDGMSVDLDAPQHYVPTRTKEKISQQFEKEKISTQLNLSMHDNTQVIGTEQALAVDKNEEDEEKARWKEEKQRRKEERRALRKFIEVLKSTSSEGDHITVKKEDNAVDTPKKKRKLDNGASQEDAEGFHCGEDREEILKGPETPKASTETKKKMKMKNKRKLNRSAQSMPLFAVETHPTPIIKASPHVQVEDYAAETTPTPTSRNKKKRKHAQESPLHLHMASARESPVKPNHGHFGQDNKDAERTSGKKRKGKKKEAKPPGESVGLAFLAPSSLLTPAAKGKADLLESVLEGSVSNSSWSNAATEKASKAASLEDSGSSEDEHEEAPRVETPIRPLKFRANAPTSPSPIHPKKEIGIEVKKETPIPPPKKLVQTATQSPVVNSKLARSKKMKAESMANNENEDERQTKKRRKSSSKSSKTTESSAEEETFSQTITSIKKVTDSMIHGLFSGGRSKEDEEDPFTQALGSMRKSSLKLESLFKPNPGIQSTSSPNKKGKNGGSSETSVRASSVSMSTLQPLVFNEEGIIKASDDWESTIGTIRSTTAGDDDVEIQESASLQSASFSFDD